MAEKKMTNIRLDPALWARVKAAAGQRGTTLERWVAEALEAHLQGAADAPGPDPADGRPGPAPERGGRGVPADALQGLHWRVEALEQAVDYLAGVVGAGFPLGGGAAPTRRQGPVPDAERAAGGPETLESGTRGGAP